MNDNEAIWSQQYKETCESYTQLSMNFAVSTCNQVGSVQLL